MGKSYIVYLWDLHYRCLLVRLPSDRRVVAIVDIVAAVIAIVAITDDLQAHWLVC